MTEAEFKARNRKLALDAVELVEKLPRTTVSQVFGKQLLRCATSVGANYRSACRAKSKADMLAKLAIIEEEADETLYWLDLLVGAMQCSELQADVVGSQANEILAMLVASIKTIRSSNFVRESVSLYNADPEIAPGAGRQLSFDEAVKVAPPGNRGKNRKPKI